MRAVRLQKPAPPLRLPTLWRFNAGCPITENRIPLLTVDVWEHAYYIDYKNERDTYFDNHWKVINWEFVEAND
ncbi:MAG: Fe-Mn family superoxide dismutase [Bdellovibrionales bacterium]|nr:Fe-Mn family superoxide dismutase [Oligoflexia bacterium]